MKIIDIFKIFAVVNIVSSLAIIFFFDFVFLLNIQVAFFSSLFIVVGSFIGYKNNIIKQSEILANTNNRDIIDDMEDKFDLYGEINENELTQDDIKTILEDEKKKISMKDSFFNTIKNLNSLASMYRIFGYLFLVLGFFYLNNNHFLNPIVYLCGFLIVPIMALFVNLKYIKN